MQNARSTSPLSRHRWWALPLSLAFWGLPVLAEDWLLVADGKSKLGKLSPEQAASLYLGALAEIPGAGRVIPLDQAETSMLYLQFHATVTRKTPAQRLAYWSKMLFNGKGEPPRQLSNSQEVIKLLRGNPSMIGYIEKSALDGSLKVLLAGRP
ncbi:phosphate ABC transporter substrate-binding protein [Chitinimonas arctica]|uniref:Phosphate ABC transporter substrate-binding protein n=1 Tax=Chitinimonas arctica TaxID=2594795 RepID=A0A516SHZ0_9NEIS|nr:phosphate ABC transporter substrate-binding protein [Chitinimonas arctica]QDQ27756.1 phosphate ABC transporter substrate-binding protein [Chitinimonas arctica]